MCKGESDDMTTEPKRPVNKRPVNKAAGKSVNQKPVNKKTANRKPVRYEDPEPVKYKKKKPHHSKKKKGKSKRSKILLFIVEIFVLLIMVVVLYSVLKIEKVGKVDLPKEDIVINPKVEESVQTSSMKGYRNIALFGVDSTKGALTKNTRSDTIMIASINLDTGDCKLVSVYRDTYLNLSNDSYNKCNSAYAKGGPMQAINMLNMNLDMNITDFITVGFEGLADTIDALGGVEIDVTEIGRASCRERV